MDSERDVTRIVRSWLRTDEHENADRVLDDVLALLDTNTQRRGWRPAWGITDVRSSAKLAIAAAAVVVVAAVGFNLLPSSGVVGGPAASAAPTSPPSPTSSPSADATIRGGPGPDPNHAIESGRYTLSTPQVLVHLTMPAGWSGDATGIYLFPGQWTGSLGLRPIAHDISYIVADACASEADVDLVEVGPTVEDLTTALENQAGIQRSGPTDITLGGYPAKKFVLTLLPACPERNGILADAARTYDFGLNHGETGTVYVVDVDGERLVITSSYMNRATSERIAELEAITTSIDIELVPTLGPRPDISGGGWLPVGRHALTVDGIRLSFSVPELLFNRGWDRYRDIYISKDTVGPQGAEAAIYWTAFPDGAATDPCANLQSLPIDASAADLAAAASTAPGTELVSGPSDVIVGGRAATHVVLTVREDLGCDPGFFFTWDPARGGPGWWTTDVGDTIRIWIVDVDGTRLVIAGETTTDAGTGLQQEIQGIVDSIQFE